MSDDTPSDAPSDAPSATPDDPVSAEPAAEGASAERPPTGDPAPVDPNANPTAGRAIITVSRVGTAVFTVTAVAAVIDPDAFALTNVVVSLLLFAVGCVVFLWAFGIAVSRSRTDAIGIGGLYFLQGTAPRSIQVALMVPFAVQIAVALVTAGLRPFSSLAFGVLVPMFGLAQAGLWGARYGHFGSRFESEGPDQPVSPK